MSESKASPGFPYDHLAVLGFDRLEAYVPWSEHGDWFNVGARMVPEGVVAARKAIQAKRAGDEATALRYATAALEADRYANEERAAGRTAKRLNVIGNAWSAWYEAITRRAAPA